MGANLKNEGKGKGTLWSSLCPHCKVGEDKGEGDRDSILYSSFLLTHHSCVAIYECCLARLSCIMTMKWQQLTAVFQTCVLHNLYTAFAAMSCKTHPSPIFVLLAYCFCCILQDHLYWYYAQYLPLACFKAPHRTSDHMYNLHSFQGIKASCDKTTVELLMLPHLYMF